jgi:hypothetical protein
MKLGGLIFCSGSPLHHSGNKRRAETMNSTGITFPASADLKLSVERAPSERVSPLTALTVWVGLAVVGWGAILTPVFLFT